MIHRDVKPGNILLTYDGRALLADFGIALLAHEGIHRATRTGMAMGSLAYMAPEQRLDARTVGPQADLHAAGATLYTLLTGSNPVDLLAAPEDSPCWEAIPLGLREVLRTATRYEVEERHKTAQALADDLVKALESTGSSPPLPARSADPEAYREANDRATFSWTTGAEGWTRGARPTAVPDPVATREALTFLWENEPTPDRDPNVLTEPSLAPVEPAVPPPRRPRRALALLFVGLLALGGWWGTRDSRSPVQGAIQAEAPRPTKGSQTTAVPSIEADTQPPRIPTSPAG